MVVAIRGGECGLKADVCFYVFLVGVGTVRGGQRGCGGGEHGGGGGCLRVEIFRYTR